jgi:hypothetical protein
MLVWQRVHYTVDVMFAPLAAYFAWWVINTVHEKSSYGLNAIFARSQNEVLNKPAP